MADYDDKELQRRLNRIIEVKNDETIRVHLSEIFLSKNEGKVLGNIKQESFQIWIHEQGRSGSTGIFYPIIKGSIKPSKLGLEITLRSKMNLIGSLTCLVSALTLGFYIFDGLDLPPYNDLSALIRRCLAGLLLLSLFMSVPAIIYFRISKILKHYLIEKLELKKI